MAPCLRGAVLLMSCKLEIQAGVLILINFTLNHHFCDEERPTIIPEAVSPSLARIHFSPNVAQNHRFAYLIVGGGGVEGSWLQAEGEACLIENQKSHARPRAGSLRGRKDSTAGVKIKMFLHLKF